MNQPSVQAVPGIALTLAQLLILRHVYRDTQKRPEIFVLEHNLVDWDVLVAYRLLYRRSSELPSGKPCFEYKLAPNGFTFMKALEA
jgi:hypothetical protein